MVTIKGFIAKLGIIGCIVLQATFAMAEAPIGQVLMATGAATRQGADGSPEALSDRADIFSGDTLETAAGAVLQIKMIDEALLVLQSDTRLVIHDYDYNPVDPASQAIRITLEKGRIRSVTGLAGQSNHDAFRLNTPIAAIGIRGTDFETVTTAERTRVRLNSGSIVFSSLGEKCLADALGPCLTESSLVLTEQLASPVAELRASDKAPRLIELQEYQSDDQASALPAPGEDDRLASQQQAERVIDEVQKPATPGKNPTPLPDVADQIHWGRWEHVALQDVPLFTEVRGEGKETLFTNDLFVLYRNENFTSLGAGSATFNLYDADAALVDNGVYTPVAVTNGALAINFDSRTFQTSLNVSSGLTGAHSLSASGAVDAKGLLRSDQGSMGVLGGLSGDGSQAGYLFTHSLSEGRSIQGATQWLRP